MTIAIISHPECALHEAGYGHPERPARVKIIQEALERQHFKKPVKFHQAPLATREQLVAAHDEDYVNSIFALAPSSGIVSIDADTAMNSHSLNAALRAAGAVVFAVDLVMQNKAQVVFCNVRPPGHHAEHDRAMGFCFFNNVAVGVRYALEQYGLKRIAIIDFDVHHGNGTQDIFQNDERVLLCSSFQHPFYPGYNPKNDNSHIINVPLAEATEGGEFRKRVQTSWFDAITNFKPELIFFSAGFDGHMNDPLAQIALAQEDYVWLTEEIAKLAKTFTDGKMISVLEGGYDLEALASCVPAHVKAL